MTRGVWPCPFRSFRNQTFGSLGIAAALHQHVKDEAILIDGPPKPLLLAANGDDDFIEIPFVAKPAFGFPPDFIRKEPTEFLGPKAHCLMRDNDPASRQHIFDHAQAERETKI